MERPGRRRGCHTSSHGLGKHRQATAHQHHRCSPSTRTSKLAPSTARLMTSASLRQAETCTAHCCPLMERVGQMPHVTSCTYVCWQQLQQRSSQTPYLATGARFPFASIPFGILSISPLSSVMHSDMHVYDPLYGSTLQGGCWDGSVLPSCGLWPEIFLARCRLLSRL